MLEERLQHYVRLLRALDWWLVGTMVLLCAMSAAFVYSATYRGPDLPQPSFWWQQLIWMGAGLVLFLVAALCDYRAVARWSPILFAMGVVALIFVLTQPRINGAKCWIKLGSFNFQPSEFAKLACLLFMGYVLTQSARGAQSFSTLTKAVAIVGVTMALVVVEPDMGMTATFVPMFFAMAFVAGARTKVLAWLLVVGLVGAAAVVMFGLKPYQRARLTSFIHPEKDLQTMMGAGWHLRQSKIAIGAGGLAGEGYLQGGQKMLGYLPRGVAHNDFIFSVYGEEWGFLGSLVLLALYGVLLWRVIRVGLRLREPLAQVLAAGVAGMLFFNIFENIGMQIGLMPITGLPLPLMSYGGSSMLSTMLALGILQSAYVRRHLY